MPTSSILASLFLLIVAISHCLCISFYPLDTNNFYPKALTTKEYTKFMTDFILEYYNPERAEKKWKPVDFNPHLMDIAKMEAERLASVGILTLPSFRFVQSYQAFSYQYYRKRKNIGYQMASNRICYENIITPVFNTTSDWSEDCDLSLIKPELYYEVGFGSSASKSGDLFAVVIYLTRQEKIYGMKMNSTDAAIISNTPVVTTVDLATDSNTTDLNAQSTVSKNDTLTSTLIESLNNNGTLYNIQSIVSMIPTIQDNINSLSNLFNQVITLLRTKNPST